MAIHLRAISLPATAGWPDTFPYTVPVIRALGTLTFTHDVTFFVGENGSGKSTVLEAIACAAGLPTVGSVPLDQDETLAQVRGLSQRLKWVWNKRTRRGFFMRSEDFFGFARRMNQMRSTLQDDLAAIDAAPARSALARSLEKMPHAKELGAIQRAYGAGLDAQSHGESYFKLFQARFVPGGLYLLDEPEAPLSPLRQLAFLAQLHKLVTQQAQFIIATHSPLLLAYPGATIYHFSAGRITPTVYDALEHVTITRDFLNNPAAYLQHLLNDAAE